MNNEVNNKDLTNIKIYITKRVNSEGFWFDDKNKLITAEKVNFISRKELAEKYWLEYLQIKYPHIASDAKFKKDFIDIIDKAIVKVYFVKYNIIVLNNPVSPEILRQSFKGPKYYPYMNGIKYIINSENSDDKFINKATDKQLALLIRLLNNHYYLKFDYSKKSDLTLEECSSILCYLTGKCEYISSDLVKKYFLNVYNDSVFNFFDNATIRESFKKSIFSFLLDFEGFFFDGELISQESCNELDRLDLSYIYVESDNDIIKKFVNAKNRKDFIMDTALYIDRSIPKIYYILYCNTYTDEAIDEKLLNNFDNLKYDFTKKLEYKLTSYKNSSPEYTLKATLNQIEFIYKLLESNDLPLILKDHRNLMKKEASLIINMLKEKNLSMEFKEKYFIENKDSVLKNHY